MRNPILAMAIVFALAAPCTALAGEKKVNKPIEIDSWSWTGTNASTHRSMPVTKKIDKSSSTLMSNLHRRAAAAKPGQSETARGQNHLKRQSAANGSRRN
jgi:hypothetical protein